MLLEKNKKSLTKYKIFKKGIDQDTKEEKQKFGQYFTSETLANLVSFPAIETANDLLFDPTSGTGTFLN